MTDNPNNSLDNLETLCNVCHTRLHGRKNGKRYSKELQDKVNALWGLSLREIGRRLGFCHGTVKEIRLQSQREKGR